MERVKGPEPSESTNQLHLELAVTMLMMMDIGLDMHGLPKDEYHWIKIPPLLTFTKCVEAGLAPL